MDIELTELKAILFREMDHLAELGYENIQIPVDFYWNIPKDFRYDPYHEPETFDLGQLSEDWQWLQNTLRGDRNPICYDLVWLSTILRAIGEHTLG